MASFYGTAFEQLEDEEKDAISKKPQKIQEEIVTDERGKRRFHGAFTGGFSAGYFNTAGSKHGWVPQTFKSSRDSRADKTEIVAAEDFMDEEDLGEFGIAAKKLRTRSDFMDALSQPGESNLLAWERSINVLPSTSATEEDDSVTSKLSELLRPLNDSIGIRLLKKMGWREGKGIGLKMSRRALEKQRVIDAASRGENAVFDEEVVAEVENLANKVDFAPDDIPALFFNSKDNSHGLGYNPLQEKSVLVQNYGVVAKGLQTSKGKKAIRGQAFGVGAFEEDDEDIYTSYDLSQYDFEIGQSASSGVKETARYDSTFVPAKNVSNARKFFVGIKPPSNFRPVHKPIKTEMVQGLPSKILQLGESMTPFQRAKFLGDRDQSIMELLSEKDRNFISNMSAERDKVAKLAQKSEAGEYEPFEEEPIKAHRFKKYVSYLKRGIYFEQPVELTRLEWEQQLAEFQNVLTPELRSLLPEVRSRQQPLAKIDFFQPVSEQLNSRFQKESNDQDDTRKLTKDHDLLQAVKMNVFGETTRNKFKWHPHKDLCKRFNVPNPYPDSANIGVVELQKRIKSSMDTFAIMNVELRTTQQTRRDPSLEVSNPTELKVNVIKKTSKVDESNQQEKAPWELLKALFENDVSSSDEEDLEEVKQVKEIVDVSIKDEKKNLTPVASKIAEILIDDDEQLPTSRTVDLTKSVIHDKVITVLDLVEDDSVYGPALPGPIFSIPISNTNEKTNGTNESPSDVRKMEVSGSNREMSEEKQRSRKRDSKNKKDKKHKESKKHKELKKHKKKKNKKKKHRSLSSESSGVEVIEQGCL